MNAVNYKETKIQTYSLSLDKKVDIGRSDSCQITVNKPEISSKHAFIFHEKGDFWVEDNDSANGTRVNGVSFTGKNKLDLNDEVQIGKYFFTLVCEFVHGKGKIYYLEICKREQVTAAVSAPTQVDMDDPLSNINLDLLSGKPSQTKDMKKSTAAEIKKGAKKQAKGKKGQNKNKDAKRNQYLKKLGAGVADRLKGIKLHKKSIASKLKTVSVLSLLFHAALAYLMIRFIVGSEFQKELKEVIVNIKDEEAEIQLPDVQELEVEEPEVDSEAITNPEIAEIQAELNEAATISEVADNADYSEFGVDSSLTGSVGNIKIGKGYKGTRDGSFMKRVLKSKGKYKGVDIRLTLLWNDYSDLDLHAVNPDETKIYYGNKESDGGQLDIDKNASDEVRDPVENIIWSKAEDGDYVISVILFTSRSKRRSIPFKVEFQIFGDVYYYKGEFSSDEEKKELEIIRFACKEGKYKILKTINDKPVKDILADEGLDIVE